MSALDWLFWVTSCWAALYLNLLVDAPELLARAVHRYRHRSTR
ncbi:hypothetical protein [Streptomyces broussonetiae]|uniref:DUF4328 domain-containing protein n=1 Tax=Streptomyces broussonetiae TaxID=2686304 RepID=A0ABV5E5N3_9ACTN